jgi:hypothetical protein
MKPALLDQKGRSVLFSYTMDLFLASGIRSLYRTVV